MPLIVHYYLGIVVCDVQIVLHTPNHEDVRDSVVGIRCPSVSDSNVESELLDTGYDVLTSS